MNYKFNSMTQATKQTVYMPVKVEESNSPHISLGYGKVAEQKEGYFFTPEQLNEYTQSIIKQALKTASENVETVRVKFTEDYEVDEQSITNTFEETFKKFEV